MAGFSLTKWKSVYHGYGANSVARLFDGQALAIRPKESKCRRMKTHAGLISGPHPSWPVDVKGNLTIEASLHTEAQLRRQNAPNPWEVGWLLWDYVDKTHFYYFIPKPERLGAGQSGPRLIPATSALALGNPTDLSDREIAYVAQDCSGRHADIDDDFSIRRRRSLDHFRRPRINPIRLVSSDSIPRMRQRMLPFCRRDDLRP